MKDLTLDLVREAFKKQYHGVSEEEADAFMDVLAALRDLSDDQILLRASDLRKEHLGKDFAILGGPILGTLDDVPNPPVAWKDRNKEEPDIHENLRACRHDMGYFLVVNAKFIDMSFRQLVVLTSK